MLAQKLALPPPLLDRQRSPQRNATRAPPQADHISLGYPPGDDVRLATDPATLTVWDPHIGRDDGGFILFTADPLLALTAASKLNGSVLWRLQLLVILPVIASGSIALMPSRRHIWPGPAHRCAPLVCGSAFGSQQTTSTSTMPNASRGRGERHGGLHEPQTTQVTLWVSSPQLRLTVVVNVGQELWGYRPTAMAWANIR